MNHKGDFLSLLKHKDTLQVDGETSREPNTKALIHDAFQLPSQEKATYGTTLEIPEATTVVAMRYNEGIIIAGDRRATAGTAVVHDRAEKVLPIDTHSVLAISGAPAMAYEIARVLKHSFQYFRRSQLQELSVEGKLRTLSRLIRENLPMAMQGIGAVIPIFALYAPQTDESKNGGKIYFYDALGAHFENVDFATTGSGSIWIRGVLRYLDRWGETQLENMDQQQATVTILRLLDTASEYDAATSGYNAKAEIFPTLKTITRQGIETLSDQYLAECYAEVT
ncbi:MAG: proteasome subunit alpha [Candidatus Poribacteria bacterium]|nr:proteasome subunit alpha [Candidatus Poribacteria bacterium]MDE0482337.1 proteasome subunit alpha [Candidatus Poribacteria bacterium]